MKITVFTPTYNRAYCLERLYKSLKEQIFKDFEWVIVDDGSIDNTKELIRKFIDEKPFFSIKYYRKENGGKHRAINYGMKYVNGEMILFMDSDDWLRSDALEWIVKVDKSIPTEEKSKYMAIEGLRVHSNGSLIGRTFSGQEYLDCKRYDRDKYNIIGDKAEVYYTNILRKYPFPEFEGEKFLTERIVWSKIAHDGYLTRYFNEGIYICEYLEDGLTHGGNCLYAKNPKQWGFAIHQDYEVGTNLYNSSIQIYIYYLYVKKSLKFKEICENLNFSSFYVLLSICSQFVIDGFRYILHNKKTILKYVTEDIKNNWK